MTDFKRSLDPADIERYKRACRASFPFYRDEQLCLRPKNTALAEHDGLMSFRTMKIGQQKIWAEIERQLAVHGRVLLDIFKARQVGSTTLSGAIATWMTFTRENNHGGIASASKEMTDIIYDIVRIMAANHNRGRSDAVKIPWPGIDKLNDNLLKLDNGSQLRVATAGESGRQKALFRGMSPNFLLGSEIAFWSRPDTFMAMIQALNTNDGSGAIAIRESTSNGMIGIGKYWYDVYKSHIEGRTNWGMVFVSWLDDEDSIATPPPGVEDAVGEWREAYDQGYHELAERIAQGVNTRMRFTEYERELILVHGATLEQVAWYARILRERYEGTDEDRLVARCQEFPSTIEESFQYQGESTFPVAKLMKMLKGAPAPVVCAIDYERIASKPVKVGGIVSTPQGVSVQIGPKTEAYDVDQTILPQDGFVYQDEDGSIFALRARPDADGLWEQFEDFDPQYQGCYLCGLDAAQGSTHADADATSAVIMRYGQATDTYYEVASCEMKGVVPDDAADMIMPAISYYRNPVVNIERPGPGEQIILRLQRAHGFSNFYVRRRGQGSISHSDVCWRQTEDARRFLIATTKTLLLKDRLVLRSKTAINQFAGMRKKMTRDGTTKDMHRRQGHDDMVFAVMLALVCQQDYTPTTMRRVDSRRIQTLNGLDFHRLEFQKLSQQTHFHPTFLKMAQGLMKKG